MSKGSSPRPFSVSQETFGNNYDAIFGKNKKAKTCNNYYNCNKCNTEHDTGKSSCSNQCKCVSKNNQSPEI